MEKLIKLLNEYTWEEYTHHNDGGWFEWEEPDYDWVCLDVRLKDKDYWFQILFRWSNRYPNRVRKNASWVFRLEYFKQSLFHIEIWMWE